MSDFTPLVQTLDDHARLVENYLHRRLEENQSADLSQIYRAASYSLFSGGKRLRPALVLESCRLAGGAAEDALPFAAALEMVHTYSLIHDDLPCMDDDDLRRGKPTNHKVFGEAMAVLAGDALLTGAFSVMLSGEHVARLGAECVVRAAAVLADKAGMEGMVGGQTLDLQGEGRQLDRAALERLQSLKTGALMEAAVTMGALVGGAGPGQMAALQRYARDLGLAFQIRDDMLDEEGDEQILGKRVGSDSRQQKSTFVSALGMDACRHLVEELTQRAVQVVEPFGGTFFEQLARYLQNRKK